MTAGIDFDPAHRDAIAAKMNLSVLQRADPAVKKVLKLASHVCLYQLDDNQAWRRLDIEGSLFVVELHVNHPNNSARARHRIFIINRKSLENYSDDVVVGNKEIELQDQMIMYTNSKQKTIGIWFYQKPEASSVFQLLQALVEGRNPSATQSPPVEMPSSQSSETSASQPTQSARLLDTSPRTQRTQKRAPRNANIKNAKTRPQIPNPRPQKPPIDARLQPTQNPTPSEASRVQDNSLERFFPGLKHTHGVAGATLPPDVNTSSVMESVAVTTLTSNVGSNKQPATDFKPTSEIDEAIIIASDNGLPDSILSKPSPSSDQLLSDAMKVMRAKAEKNPRSEPRRKSSPKAKPASRVTTPLKMQRPKRGHLSSKPGSTAANAQGPAATSYPLNSETAEARQSTERRKRTSSPLRKNSREYVPGPNSQKATESASGDLQASVQISSALPRKANEASVPTVVQSGLQATRAGPVQSETLERKPDGQDESLSAQATSKVDRTRAHLPPVSKPQVRDADVRQPSPEANGLPTAASAGPPFSNARTMDEARRQLQAMSMQQETLNDPLVRNMPPFRFPSGDMPLPHTTAVMPPPIAPPPQPPAPFTAGMHPRMAMLMQHQLFLQQQQFLAQQEHQRRMQMQNMPLPSVPIIHKSEPRVAGNMPNEHSSSYSASTADSAADLMRMLNAGNGNGTAQKPRHGEMTEEEKGKYIAQSVASVDRKGGLSSSASNKMGRSEFRAVVQRMLTDRRLFESVYANYVAADEK